MFVRRFVVKQLLKTLCDQFHCEQSCIKTNHRKRYVVISIVNKSCTPIESGISA